VALVAVLLWANRSSGTNLAWIGVLGAVLLVAWLFGHRDPREGAIVTLLLFAAPFGYGCLLGLLGAVLLLRRGGDFTAELVGFSLAGSVAMGSICGIWLSKAVRIARLTRAPAPLRSPRLVRNSDSRRRPR
jgi:hypothetical protein